MESKVFISHRSTDKEVAEMLLDFLAGTGIPKEQIFCSSLPGNDIGSRISAEVKDALKNSALNIAILSHDYYQSAYCLHEAGILWYVDIPVIAIAMPEITESNMRGFLNSEYKLRRLDSETDISYIYDAVRKETASEQKSVSIITRENEKLRRRYEAYLETRKSAVNVPASGKIDSFAEELTDDEQIVLYYMLKKQVRRVSKSHISEWLNESEIHNVNVDNAFDFLSDSNGEISSDGTFSLSVDTFRKYARKRDMLGTLKECVKRHTSLAIDKFKKLWHNNNLDNTEKLFVAYIVDERVAKFGDRWEAEKQVQNIMKWENKCNIPGSLSNNYDRCIEFFVQNNFVYASSWTSYGNVREYTLYPSLKEFLCNNYPHPYDEELESVKGLFEIPF